MHILLIHQVFTSPGGPGGARHYELAQHPVKKGHRFTVIASDVSYRTGKKMTDRRRRIMEQNLEGIRVVRVYTHPSLHRSFLWRTIAFSSFMLTSVWASLRAGRVDLVMGTSPPIFQAVSAWLVAMLRRRPFLLEIRDLWPAFAIDIGVLKNPVLIALSRWLEGFLYARATHLMVNSPAYRDYLLDKGLPAEKISLIPNGVDPDLFDPDATGEHIRQELGLDGKFVVTYAGALGLANDIPTILRSAERLREQSRIHFLIVGEGMKRKEMESLAEQLQLANVTFAGLYPKSRVSEVLAASDACVATLKDIPMFRTTYPGKVFDYMAAGRPTILAIDGVIRQVVEAAEGGVFVPPGDDAALAGAVSGLSQNPQQVASMGRSARAYVAEHFNRHQHSVQFLELLQRLTGERGKGDG